MKKIFYSLSIMICLVINGFISNAQENLSNKYDFIGKTHNTLLHSFFNDYDPNRVKTENLTKKDIRNYLITKTEVKEPEKINQIFDDPTYIYSMSNNVVTLTSYLFKEKFISETGRKYFDELAEIIDQEEENYDHLFNSIVSLEDQILAEQAIDESERGIILAATSTARFSAKFWFEELNNIRSKFVSQNETSTGNENRIPRWLTNLIGSDVGGAAGGWTAGAITGGTITLGTLTLPAATGGAILAGVSNSIASGISSLWNWLF